MRGRANLRGGWALIGPVVVLLLALQPIGVARAAPVQQSAQAGETVFKSKCSACHTLGGGPLAGPDLKGVTSLRSKDWLTRWISAPEQLIAQGDPTALELVKQYPLQMPNLGLSPAEVASVIAYLETQSGSPAPAAPAAAALPAGDPALGKEFFTGGQRLQNGGPPCMGCHSVAGLGALGGGALGPDLTPALTKFGQAGLAAFLANPPTPTMNAIWARQPLTPAEQADLEAFLQEAGVAQRPTEVVGQLAALAVAVGVVLLVLAQLVWRGRLRGVRGRLLRRTA